MGTLFLVATPIGNLEDITLRALRILAEVPLIAAEDTRTIRKLLTHHHIRRPRLLSYTERSRRTRTPTILSALDEGDVALVSEAGMPGISDPGVHLVGAAVAANHLVVPLPGPSAVTAAMAASGLPTRQFYYLGFLPRQGGRRRRLLRGLATRPETLIAFESPHRLRDTLADLHTELGDRQLAVCRELTKLHEEIFRGSLSAALDHFRQPRGEFTLVIEGCGTANPKLEIPDSIDAELGELKARGQRAREAVREVAQRYGLPHREVYKRWLALTRDREAEGTVS